MFLLTMKLLVKNVVSGDIDAVVADKTDDARTENPEKHAVLNACKCKRQCFVKVKEETRSSINKQFWELSYNERRKWLYSQVKQIPKKRCMVEAGKESRRKCTRSYFPRTNISDELSVCKVFFLNTSVYSNDKVLTEMYRVTDNGEIYPPSDKRGKHDHAHKFTDEVIESIRNHIKSYNPQVSHYCREHAPNRKYLSTDINAREMFMDFDEHFPNKIHYESYRRQIKQLNIAFVKLGQEQCEVCDGYNLHLKDQREDANCKHLCVDLQKVIMLPRLPGYKTAIFTRRLVTFNQTFAPLGYKNDKKNNTNRPLGIIWHEAIACRFAENIAST